MEKQPINRLSTIKNDPFATIIPDRKEEREAEPIVEEPAVALPPTEKPERKKVEKLVVESPARPGISWGKLTLHLDEALVNRVKNAAYWNLRLTIAKIAERGIRQAIAQVEKENGGPYPQREAELAGGRPIK